MILTQIRNSTLFLFVVCFFLFPKLQTILIAVSFLMVLFDKNFYSSFFQNQSKVGVGMFLYFTIIAFSLLYTSNMGEGLKSIETKFSFFVFPLFLPFIFSTSEKFRVNILKTLVVSGLAYVILSFITAAIDYSTSHKTSAFFYGELGVGFFQEGSFIHPGYASFFFNFLVSFLGVSFIYNAKIFNSKSLIIFLIGLFSFFILLLSSKFGILALVVNFVFLFILFIRKRKKVIAPLIILFGFLSLSTLLILQTPLKVRFEKAYSELTNPTEEAGSTKTRKDVWKVTTEIIVEHPILGVGTGDIRDELAKKYKENGQSIYLERTYDSHQQFLQTFASVGVLGFFVLLGIFGLMFVRAINQRNYLLLIFASLFLLFGLVESMLERQAGVSFFAFFGILLYSFNPSKLKD